MPSWYNSSGNTSNLSIFTYNFTYFSLWHYFLCIPLKIIFEKLCLSISFFIFCPSHYFSAHQSPLKDLLPHLSTNFPMKDLFPRPYIDQPFRNHVSEVQTWGATARNFILIPIRDQYRLYAGSGWHSCQRQDHAAWRYDQRVPGKFNKLSQCCTRILKHLLAI